ncbi:MAG: cell surface protein SprA, partial [Bacteroidales bacterium]
MALGAGYASYTHNPENFADFFFQNEQKSVVSSRKDTVTTKYEVSRTIPKDETEVNRTLPVDLKNPENLRTVIEYDPRFRSYVFRTMLGDIELGTAFNLTNDEYMSYDMDRSIQSYFRQKNAINPEEAPRKSFDPFDMRFSLGPAEKIFGPGGVQIKTQGFAELSIGLQTNEMKNPQLSEKARKRTSLDFNQEIQLNMNAKVGDKMDFNMNYNTNATFDFDAQKIKLAYQGKEDEIIKHLEAGNVSMTSSGNLIRGTQSLFGVKAGLQFGKLKLTGVIAQQESETKVINTQGGV